MEEIIDIANAFEIYQAEQADGDVVFTVTDQKSDLLKKAGDMVVNCTDGKTEIEVYAGDEKARDRWRKTGGQIASWMKGHCPKSASVICGPADKRELAVGLFLGAYEFSKYKEARKEISGPLSIVMDKADFDEVKTICNAQNMAREWAHEPASVINPWTLSERAEFFAQVYGLNCTILDDEQLRDMGAGAIVAVGQGSKTPSRMIILEYPGTKPGKPVVLVGKAITFDSGGLSLKTTTGMPDMKYDKCGAMAVFGVLRAAAQLQLETPVTGVICAAENMPDGRSYRPDDIIRSLSGKTIEIKSTDAEGRLVLADGLTYAQQNLDPRCIIDYATLTGACVTAFGHTRAGCMCTDDEMFNELFASGEKTQERIWRLPSDEDYLERLKSSEADIKNSGGREGGVCTAGMFLKSFINEDMPWAHLDIAGTAYNNDGSAYFVPGSTGFGVRLTIDWLRSLENRG
ncbi:MAG: leucyl aminopeptidase [Anaerolineaceae bacterium]|nr:leucyl aminopeptidase [Anaerolineaceae bacterium]